MPRDVTAADRLGLLVTAIMAGVALSSIATLPSWTRVFNVLGSPLDVGISGRWLVAVLLSAVAAAGTDGLVRSIPGLARVDVRFTATFWILPVLVTFAAAMAIPTQFGTVGAWLGSLVLMAALLLGVLVAEHGSAQVTGAHYRTARLGLNLATYLAAFALYATIYGLQQRSLVSATAVLLVTLPLALEVLRITEEELGITWLFAGVVALALAELTWAVNTWGLSALGGGALLLLAFYTFSGVAQQHLAGRLNRRILLEFATIAIAGLVVILLTARWA